MNVWVRTLLEREVGIMIIRRHTTGTHKYIPIILSNFPT